jgi:hypothetical protein
MAITGKVWTMRPSKCSPARFQQKEIFPCRPLFAAHSRPADTLLWFVASWLQWKRGREPREFLLSSLQTCTGGSESTMRLLPCSSKVSMSAIHYCCSWLNRTPLSTFSMPTRAIAPSSRRWACHQCTEKAIETRRRLEGKEGYELHLVPQLFCSDDGRPSTFRRRPDRDGRLTRRRQRFMPSYSPGSLCSG